ncbi:MAG: BrnA antitoxin family protein [Bdellovibrio sp.]|nr:BrnA antitoxin family protein [Bdellovibrio sp.]
MDLKQAMKKAKATRKPQKVTEAISESETKVAISIRLDADVLNSIKQESIRLGISYQTLSNSYLKIRASILDHDLIQRVEALEKANKSVG